MKASFVKEVHIVTLVMMAVSWNSASGQRSEVFPRRYASTTKEGGAVYQLLHLSNVTPQPPMWHQVLFKVDASAAGTVTEIAFRPATRSSGPPLTPAFTVDVELGFGHARRTVYEPSLYMNDNRAPDFAIVFDRKSINFPVTPFRGKGNGPLPFAYRIPFDRPGRLSAGKTGLWEMRLYQSTMTFQQSGVFGLDAVQFPFDPKDPRYARTYLGSSCTEFQIHASTLAPGMSSQISTLPLTYGFGRLSQAFICVGLSETRWAGLKLPFDLTPFGASGCRIHTSLDYVLPVVPELTVATSRTAQFSLPNVQALIGKHLYFQALAVRVGRNPLGLVTSSGLRARIGPRFDIESSMVMSPIWGRYDLGWWTLVMTPVFELKIR